VVAIEPDLDVTLREDVKWTDKQTLMVAIILRDIINVLERDVIGLWFWSPRSKDDRINDSLESLQFFEYYDHAMDVIGN